MLKVLKEELEAKERSIAVGIFLMILLRKTILLQLYNTTAKNLLKSHTFSVIEIILLQIDV